MVGTIIPRSQKYYIVSNFDALGFARIGAAGIAILRPAVIVLLQRVEARTYILESIAVDRNVIHDRDASTLAGAYRKQNRGPGLTSQPVILHNVAGYDHPLRTLKLQVVLDYPLGMRRQS